MQRVPLSAISFAVHPHTYDHRLLPRQVDEGTTLDVQVPHWPAPAADCASTPPSSRGPTRRSYDVGAAGPSSSLGPSAAAAGAASPHECRLNMPSTPRMTGDGEDETGALKYRKRRRDLVSLVRSSKFILALLCFVGFAFISYHVLMLEGEVKIKYHGG